MANFDTSNLATAQVIADDMSAKPELRKKPSPIFDKLSANANFLFVGAETLRTREDRATEVHLMARTRRVAGSARAYNHTGTFDDTMKVTPTWTTKSDTFKISLKLLDKSLFDFNMVLANKMMQACDNILEAKETEIAAWMAANRTQYSVSLKGSTFNTTNDCIDINAANKHMFYLLLKSAMRQNYYNGTYDVYADNLAFVDAEWLIAQGSANNQNTAAQFGGMNFVESNEISDANYTNGLVFVTPSQTVGALNWIPKQNRSGWGDYNSYVGGYGSFQYLGYTFAVHGYSQRADTSSTNGNAQDVVMEFEISLDSSFNAAPLSGSNSESVIYQAGLV